MKRIKLMFEYGCLPIWEEDENGLCLNGDGFPIKPSKHLEDLTFKIKEEFEKEYIDNETEFSWVGFKNWQDADEFKHNAYAFVQLLKEEFPSYIIDDKEFYRHLNNILDTNETAIIHEDDSNLKENDSSCTIINRLPNMKYLVSVNGKTLELPYYVVRKK